MDSSYGRALWPLVQSLRSTQVRLICGFAQPDDNIRKSILVQIAESPVKEGAWHLITINPGRADYAIIYCVSYKPYIR